MGWRLIAAALQGAETITNATRPLKWLGLVALLSWGAGCRPPQLPAYNRVYGVATHNSYWINRSDQQDWHGSGSQEILSDQLLHDHVRAIELDIHSNNAPDGDWLVYHTSRAEDFSCSPLSDCLQMLRAFHYAVPRHEVINVV